MGAKIYYGWRLPKGSNVLQFQHELKSRATPILNKNLVMLAEGRNEVSAGIDFRDMVEDYGIELLNWEIRFVYDLIFGQSLAVSNIPEVYNEVWLSTGVEEYGYWDNADPDEYATNWAEREIVWEAMLNDSTPIQGLIWKLYHDPFAAMYEAVKTND